MYALIIIILQVNDCLRAIRARYTYIVIILSKQQYVIQ